MANLGMDLKFEAPWHEFEFAFHILECESNVVVLSMAWMTREDGRMFSRMPNEPDMDTLTYWVTRLEPLIRSENGDEVIVIFCNRTGIEDDAVYAGTSAVIGIQDGEVKIYGLLGRGQKDLLVVDTNNPPYAKLIHRPEPNHPSVLHGELQKMNTSPASKQDGAYPNGYEQNASEATFFFGFSQRLCGIEACQAVTSDPDPSSTGLLEFG
ncbi:N-terminal amidase [Colletotrichum tofieldiae]|nr:N-terminal amidase [Colletotrichum tofieldiae]GKT77798.1 N-terminal amidase [Colletotrichum tofieldiae]